MNTPVVTEARLDQVSHDLALEMVAGLQSPTDILARYGITAAQFQMIANTPRFKALYQEAKALWGSDKNAKERIQAKALSLVEGNLLELHNIFNNEDIAPGHRLDASKQITDLAGAKAAPAAAEGAAGSRFSVIINLGDDPKDAPELVVDTVVSEVEPE
jgi:hypothetical protein